MLRMRDKKTLRQNLEKWKNFRGQTNSISVLQKCVSNNSIICSYYYRVGLRGVHVAVNERKIKSFFNEKAMSFKTSMYWIFTNLSSWRSSYIKPTPISSVTICRSQFWPKKFHGRFSHFPNKSYILNFFKGYPTLACPIANQANQLTVSFFLTLK